MECLSRSIGVGIFEVCHYRSTIFKRFSRNRVRFIVRRFGLILISLNRAHIAINPNLNKHIAKQFEHIRWKSSHIFSDHLMLIELCVLLDEKKMFFEKKTCDFYDLQNFIQIWVNVCLKFVMI